MRGLPSDFILYGFTFVNDLSIISLKDIDNYFINENLNLKRLIISAWIDNLSDCTWIVVGNKYLNEEQVKNVIDYILEYNHEDEYGFYVN